MNQIKSIISTLALGLIILLSACGTTHNAVSDNTQDKDPYEGKRVQVIQNPLSLEDFLVRAPGVQVSGNQVIIRGAGPPLFVIDGVQIGNSYLGAVQAVNPLDIESVEVLSGPDAAIFGRRGGNGVIIIRTKTF